jgi:hypothetical protein
MDRRSVNEPVILDQQAVGLSGLCLQHCLLLHAAIAVLHLIGLFAGDHIHAQMMNNL